MAKFNVKFDEALCKACGLCMTACPDVYKRQHGECAHPCRWKYYLVEETRPGEYMPVNENERGTYIYNSKDLCMIDHIRCV